MERERQRALALARKVLDRANADPDDDLAILARQLLRIAEIQYLPRPHESRCRVCGSLPGAPCGAGLRGCTCP